MMIMGGGIVSWLQGVVSRRNYSIHAGYIVGVLCFAYLAFLESKELLKSRH